MSIQRYHICLNHGTGPLNCVEAEVEIDAEGRFAVVGPANLPGHLVEQVTQQLEIERQRRERERLAEERSKALLTRLLVDDQRVTFADTQQIYVTGKATGRTYRIDCDGGYSGNVHRLNKAGVRRGSYCVYPNYRALVSHRGHLPRHDAFLGQLLLLSTDEEKFLRVAVYFSAD